MTSDDTSTSTAAQKDLEPASSRTRVSLLEKIKNPKDNKAWTRFYERYNSYVRGMATYYTRQNFLKLTNADIEDVVMKVFENITSKSDEFTYDPSKGSFRGHLSKITYFRCLDLQRLMDCRPGYNPPRDDLTGYKIEPRNIKKAYNKGAPLENNHREQTPDEVEKEQQQQKRAKQQEIVYSEFFAENTGEFTKLIEAHDLEVGRKLALEKLRVNNQNVTKRTFQIFEMLTLGTPIADVCNKLGVTPNQVAITRNRILPLYEKALREAKQELDSPGELPPALCS